MTGSSIPLFNNQHNSHSDIAAAPLKRWQIYLIIPGDGEIKANKETTQDIDFSGLQDVSDRPGSVAFGMEINNVWSLPYTQFSTHGKFLWWEWALHVFSWCNSSEIISSVHRAGNFLVLHCILLWDVCWLGLQGWSRQKGIPSQNHRHSCTTRHRWILNLNSYPNLFGSSLPLP